MAKRNRDIEFLYELGSLRNLPRAWRQHLGIDCASTSEHSFRVAFLALLIAKGEKVKDHEKILKMALLHDVVETRTGDIGYVQKVYVKADEDRAARDMFAGTSFGDLAAILKEYEKRSSKESRIVKDADNLDVDLELMEIRERGSNLPAKLQAMRKMVRAKKFYTKTAKALWDKIQKENVAQWHLDANKWKKLPNTGR